MLTSNPELEAERTGNRRLAGEDRAGASREWLLGLPSTFPVLEERLASQFDHDALADFERSADLLGLDAGRLVVDIGAGCCWTSWRLAARGWRVAATDVSEEMYVGLRSAQVYMEEYGVRFDLVLHNMSERWPYADDSIDGIVANCSIHHAQNLPAVFHEAFRVLRVGGRFTFVEGTTGLLVRTDADFGAFEKEHYGWNEHQYSLGDFRRVAREAGFVFRAEPAPSTHQKLDKIARGQRTRGTGIKYALARLTAPLWCIHAVRWLVFHPLYPLLSSVMGTQIIGVAEKPAPVSR